MEREIVCAGVQVGGGSGPGKAAGVYFRETEACSIQSLLHPLKHLPSCRTLQTLHLLAIVLEERVSK